MATKFVGFNDRQLKTLKADFVEAFLPLTPKKGIPVFAIGARLRQLRGESKLTQGEIEKRTGLLRCYISRIESVHIGPSLETLERFAGGLEVPLWQLFYSEEQGPPKPAVPAEPSLMTLAREPGRVGEDTRFLLKLHKAVARIPERNRPLFLGFAEMLAGRSAGGKPPEGLQADAQPEQK